ncbi:glycolate oxidase [Arthrobacter silviterrae]|uniref:FAD-binding protein n=1 Tax=Arthrobacter silviterrae TaxID=2026658 RepID=A0ABX0D647_9MICC|nr:FAD-linked oxidase C-terminal domain-containing protein [Arthrobacter silviterrae]MDQ0278534.1 glycolate oxidase [Arthrobacter silviterrae]NGN82208.1 FAD-binding protein [Arthrobacter silviterrae]
MTALPADSGARALLAACRLASTDPQERALAAVDRSGYVPGGIPDGIVWAETTGDVVQALQLATQHRVPIVPRGAGTGLAAGSSATAGNVVLDVSRMNRILSIDPVEQQAVVQPGVLNAEVNAATAEFGLFYAPDPASTAICSIGGNVATNAGGMWCAKYGVTRESILSLQVVLADGRILKTGRNTIKGVSGYDLNALMIGSEGTLGVVVEATLRLRPKPLHTATVAAYFADAEAAAQAASAIIAARIQPAILEFIDGGTLAAVDAMMGTDHSSRGNAFLLAQTDGYGALLEQQVLVEAITPFALSIEQTDDGDRAAELVSARRNAIPALQLLGRVSIGDIGVPRKRLAEAVAGLADISERTGVKIFVIAHAADGNLHPMVVVGPDESITEGPAKAALGEMFHLARRLGGTLTGEHGIGLLKKDWLEEEVGSLSLDLQHRIKAVFDPLGILNPGKGI